MAELNRDKEMKLSDYDRELFVSEMFTMSLKKKNERNSD